MLHFNFDEMVELHQRSPEVFELKRIELINCAIERCSGPQQVALRKLQAELDEVRAKQPTHFMQVLFEGMNKNLIEIANKWKRVAQITGKVDEDKDS